MGSNTIVQGALPAILQNTPETFFEGLVNTLYVRDVTEKRFSMLNSKFYEFFFSRAEACQARIRHTQRGEWTATSDAGRRNVYDDRH